jgi:hypothetical protein
VVSGSARQIPRMRWSCRLKGFWFFGANLVSRLTVASWTLVARGLPASSQRSAA